MSCMSKHHQELTNGVGKCSVPMWSGMGCPAGFCDEDAYGERPESKILVRADEYRPAIRADGKYSGYVPGLACPIHGGPTKEQALHLCNHCTKCIADCDSEPEFGTGKGNDNVYECQQFEAMTKEQSA